MQHHDIGVTVTQHCIKVMRSLGIKHTTQIHPLEKADMSAEKPVFSLFAFPTKHHENILLGKGVRTQTRNNNA